VVGLTICGLRVRQSIAKKVAKEHRCGHVEGLKEPVPEELHRDLALVKTDDPEVGDHENYRGHNQIWQLLKWKKEKC